MGVINVRDGVLGVAGRELARGITLDIVAGDHVAILGRNGVGKSTFLRTVAGGESLLDGELHVAESVAMLDQFVARSGDGMTVADLLVRYAPGPLAELKRESDRLVAAMADGAQGADEQTSLRYAHVLAEWGEQGGYDIEVAWDVACTRALGASYDALSARAAGSLSGGEQKRLVLEVLFASEVGILLLDEPDNFLDIPTKRWLEERMAKSRKTIVFVSHDRALVEATARKLITIEGSSAWTYVGRFSQYDQARQDRIDRLDQDLRRWEEERRRLEDSMKEHREWARRSAEMATRYRAAQTRYERYLTTEPKIELPDERQMVPRFVGSRSGDRVVMIEDLAIDGLFEPFSFELRYGDRVCLTGVNGAGKSHLLRMLDGEDLASSGKVRIGASVKVGYFSQLLDAPDGADELSLADLVRTRCDVDLGTAIATLHRYGLRGAAEQRFDELSGGQRARVLLLLLEAQCPNLLLLDEPTDNLDIESAEALEQALVGFKGSIVAVSHDRWFIQKFPLFLRFEGDGKVEESLLPSHDVGLPVVPG
jgi:ATPase subunit of ABC transporter with duplicated ATPase domains